MYSSHPFFISTVEDNEFRLTGCVVNIEIEVSTRHQNNNCHKFKNKSFLNVKKYHLQCSVHKP